MHRIMAVATAVLSLAFIQTAEARNDGRPSYGSPPLEGVAHVHQRYATPTLAAPGYKMGYGRFSPGSYGDLNTPGEPAKRPFYGFGSLNYGPFGTGMYGGGGSVNAGYGNANSGARGYGSRYGRSGYGGYGYGMGGYGYGGYGMGGYGSAGYGYGGYGLGGYGIYGYGASGALGYGDPHARFYFGASPTNDPSTYRYGGGSAVPQVPPFQNFARPSGLVPYSYLYVNPRTPQDPAHPEVVANPFAAPPSDDAPPAAK